MCPSVTSNMLRNKFYFSSSSMPCSEAHQQQLLRKGTFFLCFPSLSEESDHSPLQLELHKHKIKYSASPRQKQEK